MAQLRATKDALLGLGHAHVDLAKAEADEIKGEVARAAGLVAGAVALLLLFGILLPIGGILFTGEWLFGSIGWGLLLGAELLVALAVSLVVAAVRVAAFRKAAALGLIVGIVAFLVLGASLPHWLFRVIGDNVEAGVRPLLVAIAIVGALGALVGLIGGARVAGVGGAIGGLVAGALVGGLTGAFLAVDFGWRVGVALGLVVAVAVYLAVLGMSVADGGIDGDKLKARFWPQATIDTTRETIEWAKARIPRGPRS